MAMKSFQISQHKEFSVAILYRFQGHPDMDMFVRPFPTRIFSLFEVQGQSSSWCLNLLCFCWLGCTLGAADIFFLKQRQHLEYRATFQEKPPLITSSPTKSGQAMKFSASRHLAMAFFRLWKPLTVHFKKVDDFYTHRSALQALDRP